MSERQLSSIPDNCDEPSPSSSVDELGTKPSRTRDFVSSVWSFPGRRPTRLYRWYGTLPRPLVQRLLLLYATDSRTSILDPFAGTGTTLDVAADLQLSAKGLECNPLACLVAQTRLFGLPSDGLVTSVADQVMRSAEIAATGTSGVASDKWSNLAADERYDYMRKWFREDTLTALLALLFQIAEVEDHRIQRFLFVAAAQIVRAVASVDPRCTHHLVTKEKPFVDPLPLWRDHASRSLGAVRSNSADPSLVSVEQTSVFEAQLDADSADFVLTHPPYVGVIHYHLIHRLATDLLDIVNLAESPVSLRDHDFDHARIKASDVSTDSTKAYRLFVEKLAVVMRHVVAPDGRCVVVIGDQRHKGHLRHPFTDFINRFEDSGFDLEENFIWVLQNNAGMHVLRRGHFIDHNYILVFHKKPAA